MKKLKFLNDFWFGVLLVFAIMAVLYCFQYASAERIVENKVGGEVFTLALPLLIAKWKLWTVEQGKKANRMRIKQLSHQKMQEIENM